MAQERKQIVRHCVDILNSFHKEDVAIEEHLYNYFNDTQDPTLTEDKIEFISTIFTGCERYTQLLSVVISGFYALDGQRILRSEENLYRVFGYICLFQLEELGMAEFSNFVKSQDTHKMHTFLKFMSNEKNIRTWMKDEWNKLYETSFVQDCLINPLLRYLPELHDLMTFLKEKLDNKVKRPKPNIATTEMQPFNITKPKPKRIPMPDPLPAIKSANPVPNTTYKKPKEVTILLKTRELNRRQAEEGVIEASRTQFACANPEKSEKTKQKLRNLEIEEDMKLDFDKHKSNPVPDNMLTQNMPIRLNAAAILREGKLYKKKEAEELRKLRDLEAGAYDSSQFQEWQSKMKQQDLDNEIAAIEKRRIEGKLSMEEAILAKGKLVKENKEKVHMMKKENAELMKQYMQQKMIEEQETRNLVESVISSHSSAKEAREKVKDQKSQIAKEVNKLLQEERKWAEEQAELEMQQKLELIQQIRAMEGGAVKRKKSVNLTASAGYGLLSEMSIAKLREKLELLKIEQQEEEEQKRDEIITKKQEREKMLLNAMDTITRHRTEQTRAASNRFEAHKTTRHLKPEVASPEVSELQRKLEAKKQERFREQQNARITPNKHSAQKLGRYALDKKSREQSRWAELEQRQQAIARVTSSRPQHSSQSRVMVT